MTSSQPRAGSGPPSDQVIEHLLAFVERTSDLVGVADDAGNVLYANHATRARLGLSDDDVRNLTTADLFPVSSFELYHDEIRPAILRDGVWSGAMPVHGESGTTIDAWVTIVGGSLPGGEISWLVVSGRDITQWRRLADELTWRATHDDLTGLARRVLLDDRLDLALARARREHGTVAVIFLDVDDLKSINDTFGHRAGDDVLAEVGHRMESAVRTIDTVARLGGDEFVVVLDGVDNEAEAELLAARVRDAVMREPVDLPGSSMAISVSVGVATSTGDASSTDLLRRADSAMFGAKRERGSAVVVSTDPVVPDEADVHDLGAAITRRLVAARYQPIVDLQSGVVVGHQALARWGETPASDFIDLTDGTGFGLTLDLAVLRQATTDAASWDAPRPRAYVHVGSAFLAEPRMTSYVEEILERSGLPAADLAVEIPERLLARHGSVFTDAARSLRALGVRLVVSDMGIHSSSIADLAEGLFDEMRLALPLVLGVTTDSALARATAGVVALAHGLGLTAIAVGVEDPGQRDRLVAMGCDFGEGWLLGPIVDAAALADDRA